MDLRRFNETPWVLYRGEKLEIYVAVKGAIWYAKATAKSIKYVTEDPTFTGTEREKRLVQKLRRQERTLLVTTNEILKHQKSKGIPVTAAALYKQTGRFTLILKRWTHPTAEYARDRAVQIISNGIKLVEVLTNGGETVFTNIPAREGDQEHIINVYTSNLLTKALSADGEGYKKLAETNREWYARYYVWIRPLILEAMSLQYQRGGFKAYELYNIVCIILGLETGLKDGHRLIWNELVDRTRQSWLTEWITIFHKIQHFFHGNIDADTTCLAFIFRDLIEPTEMALITHHESKMLEQKVRIVHKFHGKEICRRCFGREDKQEKCTECEMSYCSETCRLDDFLDHLEECGVLTDEE